MYCVIALSIIVFSVLSVTSRKILRSATYLLFTLFATAAPDGSKPRARPDNAVQRGIPSSA